MADSTESLQEIAPVGNMSIWGREPHLPGEKGNNYYGRVFVEVWDSDLRLGITGSPELGKQALIALQNKHERVSSDNVPWNNEPALGSKAGNILFGRVVIELWDTKAAVSISGAEPDKALAGAIEKLQNLITPT